MKNLTLTLLALGLAFATQGQSKSQLKGSIGQYNIEMELWKDATVTNALQGRYRYQGKTAYLDLQGTIYHTELIKLEESWQGKPTGTMIIEMGEEGKWVGKWSDGAKLLDVTIEVTSGQVESYYQDQTEALFAQVNSELSGTYRMEYYFFNQWNLHQDHPELEIGFNGGDVEVKMISEEELEIRFDLLYGPTFHNASFQGRAHKIAPGKYEFHASAFGEENEMGADEPLCHMMFEFENKIVYIQQLSSSLDCGFGMRAYVNSQFKKVGNDTDRR